MLDHTVALCARYPSCTAAKAQGVFHSAAINLSTLSRHKSQYGHRKCAHCMHHPREQVRYHGARLALTSHKTIKKIANAGESERSVDE